MNSWAKGLTKFKKENGFVGRVMMGYRRSTGQRYNETELGGARILRPELRVVPEIISEGDMNLDRTIIFNIGNKSHILQLEF